MSPDAAWNAAVAGEVAFWRNWLETNGGRWPERYAERFDPTLPLQPEIEGLIRVPDGERVRILDAGAGPLTFVGRTSERWPIEITAVDALGDAYRDLLDEMGAVAPVPTQQCETERLTTLLEPESFDVVTARNTLDHSVDPVLAITEMLACTRPGGALLLVHHRNTAVDEKYRGMHQWNFEGSLDELVVWRPGQRIDVMDVIGDRAAIESVWLDGTWENIAIRRSPSPAP